MLSKAQWKISSHAKNQETHGMTEQRQSICAKKDLNPMLCTEEQKEVATKTSFENKLHISWVSENPEILSDKESL